jgi:hypothetical protein
MDVINRTRSDMAEDLPHALMLSDVAQRAKIGKFSRQYRELLPSTDRARWADAPRQL